MTAIELNAQILRDMAEIADSEPLMKQLAKYLKKLVAKKTGDHLQMRICGEGEAKICALSRILEIGSAL